MLGKLSNGGDDPGGVEMLDIRMRKKAVLPARYRTFAVAL